MLLRPGGMDIFYIDESNDRNHYVVTAVRVPFLRKHDKNWHIVWPDYLRATQEWRRGIKQKFHVPLRKELHGLKLASGRGGFVDGKFGFKGRQAFNAYKYILDGLTFLPDSSVMSAVATRGKNLYGHDRLEAALYALFQRMRRSCSEEHTNAMVFFDEGHPEYRQLYRMAQKYLPTGSKIGAWASGNYSKNMPMDMFTKDGNEKSSKHCYFTQIADLIAYAAFMKIKSENDQLTDWQDKYDMATLYDTIPSAIINTMVSLKAPRDGIVRLK